MVASIGWPFRPDWSDAITERLSWLTAIQTSRTGAEQRQALRVSPRRQLDFPVLLTENERSYFEILMARNGGVGWLVPLPHEEIPVGTVQVGTDTFEFDTSYREMGLGTKMLVRGMSALQSEIVEVTSISSDHITTTPTTLAYPLASITPTFNGVMSEKTDLARRTSRVYTGTVRFSSLDSMIWPTTTRTLAAFPMQFNAVAGGASYPVMTVEPNAINDLTYSFERMWSVIDNSQSVPVYSDQPGRQFTSQQYEWFLYGRKERQDFRDMLFQLQGKCKPVWLPTFNDDVPIGGYPNPLGFETTPPPGREFMAAFYVNGTVVCLATTAYTAAGLPPVQFSNGNLLRQSFMSLHRLDTDDIEFAHQSASDGVATVSAVFRDAPDLRNPLTFTTVGYPKSGYWPGSVDTGTRAAATNASTGLADTITITGAAGGGT